MVGGLVRDRLPQLRIYLRHLQMLESNGAEIRWLFLLDNCNAETVGHVQASFPEAALPAIQDGGKAYDRIRSRQHKRMAMLRNKLRAFVLASDAAGLLSIDSDIVIRPDLLAQLLRAGRPWVAALVDNSRGGRRVFNVLDLHPRGKEFRWIRPDRTQVGEADAIGAVCFYRRDLLERCSFEYDPQGEDLGFARQARAAGIRGAYLPLELEHLMIDKQVAAHLAQCEVCRR